MEITGKIIAVLPANSGTSARTGNPWMSQTYVIETQGQYPKKLAFDVFGEERIKQFNIKQGEELTVSFDFDAHEYNGRWFNEIRAYNVNRGVAAAPVGAPMAGAAPQTATSPFPPTQEPAEGSSDDLPF